jgi:hypothetical protein
MEFHEVLDKCVSIVESSLKGQEKKLRMQISKSKQSLPNGSDETKTACERNGHSNPKLL